LAALAGIGVAAASSVRELSAKAADILSAYEPSGETQSCLMLRQIDAIRPIDDETFLVETNGGAYYVNHPTHACSGAARANRRLEYTTSQPTLCAGDIIRVVDNSGGFMAGSCALGQFERLIPKAPA
jgi:hypothetical protein